MKSIPKSALSLDTVLKAPYLLQEDNDAYEIPGGDALIQDHPEGGPCVIVRLGTVVRRHFGSRSLQTVLRVEYGITNA